MEFKRGRYSWLLRPALIIFDLITINLLAFEYLSFNNQDLYFFSINLFNNKHFLYFIFSVGSWLTSTYIIKFYKVYRYTSVNTILLLLIKQFIAFCILTFAFTGVFRSIDLQAFIILKYICFSFIFISIAKIFSYYILKSIRAYIGGNIRRVVIIGSGKGVTDLKKLFLKRKGLGYVINAVFNDANDETKTGSIQDSFEYLKADKNIDEIYCGIDELSKKQINDYVKLASQYRCNIKFVPNDDIYLLTKRFEANYYNYLPVLSIQEITLNSEYNRFFKRSFDIVFSLLVIILILSWLSVLLFFLIKLESKGPLLYKQLRNGINYREFYCYKFRSLRVSKVHDETYVKKDDDRVTKIGAFLRKTSLDELPQFINVLKGDMSVVGPRPHMLLYTDEYSKVIDKYNFIYRHNVKPGITGLAQIKGYRGEIKSKKDIINRIKYDIFYIENWSLILDIKIILGTFSKMIKGDENAY